MEIINSSRMANFNNTTRTYYDAHDIRISDVWLPYDEMYHTDMYHTHNEITEILFVLEGRLSIKIMDNCMPIERIVNSNKLIIFKPNERHCVKPFGDNARVIVFKYLKTDKELLDIFISDWE